MPMLSCCQPLFHISPYGNFDLNVKERLALEALAKAVQDHLLKLDAGMEIFFSPVSLGQGFWLPKLAEGIRNADAFLLLLGPNGVGGCVPGGGVATGSSDCRKPLARFTVLQD